MHFWCFAGLCLCLGWGERHFQVIFIIRIRSIKFQILLKTKNKRPINYPEKCVTATINDSFLRLNGQRTTSSVWFQTIYRLFSNKTIVFFETFDEHFLWFCRLKRLTRIVFFSLFNLQCVRRCIYKCLFIHCMSIWIIIQFKNEEKKNWLRMVNNTNLPLCFVTNLSRRIVQRLCTVYTWQRKKE